MHGCGFPVMNVVVRQHPSGGVPSRATEEYPQAWFNDVAMIGVALIISTLVFFAMSIRERRKRKEDTSQQVS